MGVKDWFKGIRGSTFQLNDDDIVVFLVGPSGSGKSLFVSEVTKSGAIIVGTTLRPSTVIPQAIRCELTEEAKANLGASIQRNIVFVDTPSFNTAQHDGAEKEMNQWLSKSKSKSTLVGTIYMHRVETDPVHEPIQPHLDAFARSFPNGFVSLPRRLHAVFSFEGDITRDRIERRRVAFQTQLGTLKKSLVHGGMLRWHTSLHPNLFRRGDPDIAWQAVVALFSSSGA